MSDYYDDYKKVRFFGSLDGLRAICILGVLWHHGPILASGANLPNIANRGNVGVDFFFILSGFLITTLLLREREKNGQISLRHFYWRRALRILPVYFFVTTSVSAYYILVKGQEQYLDIVIYYYVFLSNFLVDHIPLLSVTWSLSVEEQFYFLWPLMLIFLSSRFLLPALYLLIVVNVAGAAGFFDQFGLRAVDIGPLKFRLPGASVTAGATYAPILMGSAIALLLNKREIFLRFHSALGSFVVPYICFAALLLQLEMSSDPFRGTERFLTHLIMSAALISLVVREDNGLFWFLSRKYVARIGTISYGVYLYHLIGLDLTNRLVPAIGISSPTILFGFYILTSILLAEVSFRTLEHWFSRFRHIGVAAALKEPSAESGGANRR